MTMIDKQMLTPRERHQAKLREATEQSDAANKRAAEAAARVTRAKKALKAHEDARAIDREKLFAGIERMLAAAQARFDERVGERARDFVALDASVPELGDLPALYVATLPGFGEALLAVADRLHPPTTDEHELKTAELRAERSQALQDAAIATGEKRRAGDHFKAVKHGTYDDD